MAVTIPGSYTPIDIQQLIAGAPIRTATAVDVIENINWLWRYYRAPTTQLFQIRTAAGISTTSTSSTNWIREYRRSFDPSITTIKFRARLKSDSAAGNAYCKVQVVDDGTAASATVSTNATTYTGGAIEGTITRTTFDTDFSQITVALYADSGRTASLKSLIVWAEPASSIPAGVSAADFIAIDSNQAASGAPYTHALIVSALRNIRSLQRYRRWPNIQAGEGTDRTYAWTTDQTAWTLVARQLFRVHHQDAEINFAVDGFSDSSPGSSTSAVRILIRPAYYWGTDPDNDPNVTALPDSAGIEIPLSSCTWGTTTPTWVSDGEVMTWTPPAVGDYEVLVQAKSDGTYDPYITALSAWPSTPALDDIVLRRNWTHSTRAWDLAHVVQETARLYGHTAHLLPFCCADLSDAGDLNSASDYDSGTYDGAYLEHLATPNVDAIALWFLVSGAGTITTRWNVDTADRPVNLPLQLQEDGTGRNHDGGQAQWLRMEYPAVDTYSTSPRHIDLVITDKGSSENGKAHIWASCIEEIPLAFSADLV